MTATSAFNGNNEEYRMLPLLPTKLPTKDMTATG